VEGWRRSRRGGRPSRGERQGIGYPVVLPLTPIEEEQLHKSAGVLKDILNSLEL